MDKVFYCRRCSQPLPDAQTLVCPDCGQQHSPFISRGEDGHRLRDVFWKAGTIFGMQIVFWVISLPGIWLMLNAGYFLGPVSGPGAGHHAFGLLAVPLLFPLLCAAIVNLPMMVAGISIAVRTKLKWGATGKLNLFRAMTLSPVLYFLMNLWILMGLFQPVS
jgi:hypothetical protein